MKLAALTSLLLVSLALPTLANDLSDTLMRAGLDSEALAAAGVVSSEVAAVVQDASDWITVNPTALSVADSDFMNAKAEVGRISKLARNGKASSQDIADLGTEKQNQASAQAARDSALNAVFNAGTNALTTPKTGVLTSIRQNRPWGTDLEFMAKDRSDQDWLRLVEALTDERVSLAEGVSASATCTALLLSERSGSAVSAAKVALDTNASAVLASWTSAVSGA